MHHLARGVDLLHHLHLGPGLAGLDHLETRGGGGLLAQTLLNYLWNKLGAALGITVVNIVYCDDTGQTCC